MEKDFLVMYDLKILGEAKKMTDARIPSTQLTAQGLLNDGKKDKFDSLGVTLKWFIGETQDYIIDGRYSFDQSFMTMFYPKTATLTSENQPISPACANSYIWRRVFEDKFFEEYLADDRLTKKSFYFKGLYFGNLKRRGEFLDFYCTEPKDAKHVAWNIHWFNNDHIVVDDDRFIITNFVGKNLAEDHGKGRRLYVVHDIGLAPYFIKMDEEWHLKLRKDEGLPHRLQREYENTLWSENCKRLESARLQKLSLEKKESVIEKMRKIFDKTILEKVRFGDTGFEFKNKTFWYLEEELKRLQALIQEAAEEDRKRQLKLKKKEQIEHQVKRLQTELTEKFKDKIQNICLKYGFADSVDSFIEVFYDECDGTEVKIWHFDHYDYNYERFIDSLDLIDNYDAVLKIAATRIEEVLKKLELKEKAIKRITRLSKQFDTNYKFENYNNVREAMTY